MSNPRTPRSTPSAYSWRGIRESKARYGFIAIATLLPSRMADHIVKRIIKF